MALDRSSFAPKEVPLRPLVGVTPVLRNKAVFGGLLQRRQKCPGLSLLAWDVAPGPAGGLEALELVQGLVEAPLYSRVVAGEFRKAVRFVCTPDKGSAERGGLRVFVRNLHLLRFGESFLVLLFVRYSVDGPYWFSAKPSRLLLS